MNELNKEYAHLKAEQKYTVVKSFRDFDNYFYETNDILKFIGFSFLPYEDGLSLFVIYKGNEKQIRLQLRQEEQLEIVQNLDQYLVPVNS